MGSLLDHFLSNEFPYQADDIEAFWSSFLGLAKGIETMQGQPNSGLHGDLKPSNILLFQGRNPAESKHSFMLTIADFGSSRIGSINESPDGSTPLRLRSTRTYGAPEVYSISDGRLETNQSVDIWSLGCILMEVAVWITGGFKALESFKVARVEETSKIPDFHEVVFCDCFHQGYDLLPSVKEWARIVQENARRNDNITPRMVDFILNSLLRPESFRCSPQSLEASMREIISSTKVGSQAYHSRIEQHPPSPSSIGSIPPITMRPLMAQPVLSVQTSPQHNLSEMMGSPVTPMSPSIYYQHGPTDNTVIQRTLTDPTAELMRSNTTSPYPNVTLRELALWRGNKKKYRPDLPGWKEAQNLLRGRDFLFIIDNSRSMFEHQAAVIEAVDNLAYLVKQLDPDGGEIRWTSSPQTKESFSNSTQAGDSARRAFAERSQVDCNMEGALIEALPTNFRSGSMASGTSWGIRSGINRIRSNSSAKRLSVLIFTDGVWVPSDAGLCGADRPIEHLIQQMKSQGVQRSGIAVQFLRFGSDPAGIGRLDYLDNELAKKPENQGFDIVDHKSEQDSVWGILIGSVFEAMDHLG
ncbi:unnamed protein product [Clonostachys rhizophaga]|uniref:Protein kinase domain-containing protein n=1 Tax=Clonostachys rhizophaga TaxID=160324 RepID=A0A9N9YHC1_9HYPO|nr:unnamed protein product [Clonostachys rhizophaga]